MYISLNYMKLFKILNIQHNLYKTYNYIEKYPKKELKIFRILLLNESFFLSYLQIILWIHQVLKHPITILFLDSRNFHQKVLSTKFGFLKAFTNVYQGFMGNKVIINKYQVKRKKIKLKLIPHVIVIFDLSLHLNLIKEAFKFQIPVICFFNKQTTYNNLYKLAGTSSLRTYILFVCIFSLLYLKSLVEYITYSDVYQLHIKVNS